jgi:hypothetical protein
MDQAGWRVSNNDCSRKHPHPAAAQIAHLNPVENFWQRVMDNQFSHRVFKSPDDIVDHCCCAWKILQQRSWKILSIDRRQ